MDTTELLEQQFEEITSEATGKMARSHLRHYEMRGATQTRERLKALCRALLESLQTNSPSPMIRYAEKIGEERFSAGFALGEVQTAFNVLEESIWNKILEEMKPEEYAKAVDSVNEMLRTGKEAVARIFFSHVTALPPWD